MNVPLLDLKKQYKTIREEIIEVTEEIYESQRFILGPKVESLESDIATYCSAGHATGVSSGTDALLISLMATGVKPGDMVITTPYSFFATAGSIARLGVKPVFADIDPYTYNVLPDNIEHIISGMTGSELSKLKGIMPVHLYGQCADMDSICSIAKKHNLFIIEDAAQAIGAEYKGKRAGTIGDMGCFSFFPSKNLGAFGDGGIVTTNSDELNEKLRILRAHGGKPKYFHKIIGGNFRLDALQAGIVSVKLKYLDTWTDSRKSNGLKYREMFNATGLDEWIRMPIEKEQRHIYNQFIIHVKDKRDELRMFLQEAGIGTEVYYPVPLHLQECFSYLNYKKGDFPAAEHAANHTLALPIYPELTDPQLEYVVDKIKAFYTKRA